MARVRVAGNLSNMVEWLSLEKVGQKNEEPSSIFREQLKLLVRMQERRSTPWMKKTQSASYNSSHEFTRLITRKQSRKTSEKLNNLELKTL